METSDSVLSILDKKAKWQDNMSVRSSAEVNRMMAPCSHVDVHMQK